MLLPFFDMVSSLCEPSDVDLTVAVLSVPLSLYKPLVSFYTAVMSLFLVKSGPPDSSDGPDLICLSQTH